MRGTKFERYLMLAMAIMPVAILIGGTLVCGK